MTAIQTVSPFMKRNEVATLFHVNPTTVDRWGAEGGVLAGAVVRTPGGRKLYKRAVIEALAAENGW